MIIEKKKLLSEESSVAEVMNKSFAAISKSLNLKDCFESNVDIISNNIKHSFKSVSSENHVNVKIIRKKNMGNGNGISNKSQLKSSKR